MSTYIHTFGSLGEFIKYISTTPYNSAFHGKTHSSVTRGYTFTKTYSYEEALDLAKNGWDDMAGNLEQRLTTASKTLYSMPVVRNVLDVYGYQPVVPLYLAGIPQNMVNKQILMKKQKVVEITKSVCYHAGIESDKILEESVKAMMVIKKLERQGVRVKLNIVFAVDDEWNPGRRKRRIVCKVCIKQPGERLNVSKLAFPMVHPSMLRRLMFRFVEVCPDVSSVFVMGYGFPVNIDDIRKIFKDDIILPEMFDADINTISNIDQLKAALS